MPESKRKNLRGKIMTDKTDFSCSSCGKSLCCAKDEIRVLKDQIISLLKENVDLMYRIKKLEEKS